MREILLSILGGILLLALALGGKVYCGGSLPPAASPIACQQAILRHFAGGPRNCLCKEIRVRYSVELDGHHTYHLAHYDPGKQTLRIETDPGSGWTFGWENIDTPLIERVIREGGDFRLFTTYRPDSKHPPGSGELPY